MLVQDGTERQTVPERGGHVGDVHIWVPLALQAAPLLQSFDRCHSGRGARPLTGKAGSRKMSRGGRSFRELSQPRARWGNVGTCQDAGTIAVPTPTVSKAILR